VKTKDATRSFNSNIYWRDSFRIIYALHRQGGLMAIAGAYTLSVFVALTMIVSAFD